MAMFHMANDSHLFAVQADPDHLALYEAKMVHQFDHRFGDYADKPADSESTALPDVPSERLQDPFYSPCPRYWVDATEVETRLAGRWPHRWLLGWRDICRATDARTVIAAVIPRAAVNDKFLLMIPAQEPALVAALCANLCSFALDYAARQKVGGTSLKYFTMRQFPILAPSSYRTETQWMPGIAFRDWLLPRVLELTYTAWNLEPFAQDCGWPDPPFRWDENRRFYLRCELDAAFFHLYLPADAHGDWRPAESEKAQDLARLTASYPTPRDAVSYIMDTFPIVRRKDEAKYDGDYRTKRVILEIYDAMQEAMRTGEPYQTRLNPPPADPSCCHPPREAPVRLALADPATLSDGAWMKQGGLDRWIYETEALAAVLKAYGAPAPHRQVRLAALLVMEPRLLTPSLDDAEASLWQRLVGDEASPLAADVTKFQPRADNAWGKALSQLRGTGRLVEDLSAQTWSPGPGLDDIETSPWSAGRACMVLAVLRQRGEDALIQALPEIFREALNAEAA
jgi:hypothetical protein